VRLGPEIGTPNERLFDISQRVKNGEPSASATVRELLSWFGASRRGYWIVERIRKDLEKLGLVTDPDFESAYIGSTISLKLANGQSVSGLQMVSPEPAFAGGSTRGAVLAISLGVQSDPTYRISKLAAANNPPISVRPDGSLQEAVTLMMSRDFSQLPVMTSEREVKGVISWASIGSRLAMGKTSTVVRDFMDQYQEIKSDASLFEAIEIIVQNQYILIRGKDNRISGRHVERLESPVPAAHRTVPSARRNRKPH
jgi:CBS domain-containing protein